MANLSEASGFISLDGPWTRDQIENILYVIYSQDGGGDYDTSLVYQKMKDDIDTLQQGHGIKFFGTGRWSYTSNLESFNSWTDISEPYYKSTRAYNEGLSYEAFYEKRKQIMLDMVRNKLSITFDFSDMDTAVDMAYKATAEISAEYYYDTTTTTSEAQFVTRVGNEESYDCNMKFLCEEIRDDDEQLYGFLYEYATYKKIPFKDTDHKNEVLNKVGHIISNQDDWYNLPAYPDTETFEEYNKETADIINKLIDRYLKETS
jgi:hypothetical protein